MRLVIFIYGLFLISACQSTSTWIVSDKRDLPWMGKIYATQAKSWIAEQDLHQDLQAAQIVLLGERHDHPDHWRLQYQISKMISDSEQSQGQLAFVFEHFHRQQQAVLDKLIEKQIPIKDWGEHLNWEKSGWPEWSRFVPLIELALQKNIAILAGNLSKEEIQKLFRNDLAAVFEQQLIQAFRLDHELLKPELQVKLAEQMASSHCHPLPEPMKEAMVRVQRGRDLLMASVIWEQAMAGKKVILFAGSGHVRKDWGVVELLARRQAEAPFKLRSLALTQAPDDWQEEQALAFDFVWLTPAFDLRDPCEVYRDQLQKFRKQQQTPAGQSQN